MYWKHEVIKKRLDSRTYRQAYFVQNINLFGDHSPLETQLLSAHSKICIFRLHYETFSRSSSCTLPIPAHKIVAIKCFASVAACWHTLSWSISYCQSLKSFPFLWRVDFVDEESYSYLGTARGNSWWETFSEVAHKMFFFSQTYPSSSLLIWSQKPMMYSQSSCLLVGWVALSVRERHLHQLNWCVWELPAVQCTSECTSHPQWIWLPMSLVTNMTKQHLLTSCLFVIADAPLWCKYSQSLLKSKY